MVMVRWDPSLAVGDAMIDAQHQELFERYEALLEAMATGDRGEIAALYDFLGAYALEHFAAEERLMAERDFPGRAVHKASHDRFVRDYQALRGLFEAHGATAAVSVKTKVWLSDWLRKHIGGADRQMALHVLKRSA